MKKQQLIVLILLNLFIAFGFFFKNSGAGFTQLSSDLMNSLPVCYKIDDSSLFQKDLFLDNVNNVKYYTPFYIQSIRFFAFCADGDYLAGINIFAVLVHLIYGFSWFFFFYKVFGKFSIALFLSVLVRGIIWLPGFEIWGISDIWTMMPRTLYAAFMPLPFLLLLYRTTRTFLLSAFLIGFIFNFHPITGMGGMLIYVLFIFLCWCFYRVRIPFKILVPALVLAIIGMLPFLSTYFLQTDTKAVYDMALYKKAFAERIPGFFTDPVAFIQLWFRFKTLFFAIPVLAYLCYALFFAKEHRKKAFILFLIPLATIAVFSVSVYVENAVNAGFNLNLRMAFQMIRAQKLAILPGYIALGFLLKESVEKSPWFAKAVRIGLPVCIVLLLISKEPFIKKIPFFGDDIATSIFPDYHLIFLPQKEKIGELDRMLAYIKKNTKKTDVFWDRPIIRVASLRPVVADSKGASMLIEGNPVALIQWYQDKKHMDALTFDQKLVFLKEKKSVTHILSNDLLVGKVKLVHAEGIYKLYQLQ